MAIKVFLAVLLFLVCRAAVVRQRDHRFLYSLGVKDENKRDGIARDVRSAMVRELSTMLPAPTDQEHVMKRFTLMITPPIPAGCEYNGKIYPPGDIPELSGKRGNCHYGAYCAESSGSYSIIHWDGKGCFRAIRNTEETNTKDPDMALPSDQGIHRNGTILTRTLSELGPEVHNFDREAPEMGPVNNNMKSLHEEVERSNDFYNPEEMVERSAENYDANEHY
ncbi:uncharacterized protein LOC133196558 [Saccostrea echinata]|uniref:uncharacterized protein LOC133196558 n=1 Tax=Saccostrea echinata TaxID=191078 RepID=UPI002A7ED5BA|nr:uncharacterized protein LOC133196558 [Saccostrea echinata]